MNNTGKSKTVFLKQDELDRVQKLMLNGIKFVTIVRRGIAEFEKDSIN